MINGGEKKKNLERVGKSKRIYRGLYKKFILIFHMQITAIMNNQPSFVTGIIWSKTFEMI